MSENNTGAAARSKIGLSKWDILAFKCATRMGVFALILSSLSLRRVEDGENGDVFPWGKGRAWSSLAGLGVGSAGCCAGVPVLHLTASSCPDNGKRCFSGEVTVLPAALQRQLPGKEVSPSSLDSDEG